MFSRVGLPARERDRILRGYGIRNKGMRFQERTAKGYERHQFTDAITRYVRD